MTRRRLPAALAPGSVPAMDPGDDGRQHDDQHDSRRPAVIGLIVVAVLVIAAYFLFTALRQSSQMEDCLMSGRRNCAPIETPPTSR